MTEKKYSIEVLGQKITAVIINTGDGINAAVAGGDKGHIGAVSIKLPGKEVVTREFPGHKDSAVAEKWAENLCNHFDCTAVVTCGIHYDDLSREGIQKVLSAADILLEKIISSE